MTSLFEWAGYPHDPGYKARDTSREAAESAKPTAAYLRAKVLDVIEHSNGLTADECAGRMRLTPFSTRPRCTELSRLGLIRDSGARRENVSGKTAIVWMAITPARLKRKSN